VQCWSPLAGATSYERSLPEHHARSIVLQPMVFGANAAASKEPIDASQDQRILARSILGGFDGPSVQELRRKTISHSRPHTASEVGPLLTRFMPYIHIGRDYC